MKVVNVSIIHKKYKSQKSPLLTTSKFLSIFPCEMQENVHRIYILARVCFCLSFSCSRLIKIIKPRNLNKLRYSIHTTIYWQHNSKGKHDIAFHLWHLYSSRYNLKSNIFLTKELHALLMSLKVYHLKLSKYKITLYYKFHSKNYSCREVFLWKLFILIPDNKSTNKSLYSRCQIQNSDREGQ